MASDLVFDGLILDCDGVIFDSNKLKSSAFRAVISPWGRGVAETFVSYHETRNGISRELKLRQFNLEVNEGAWSERDIEEILDRYGTMCLSLYRECAFCPGALDVLQRFGRAGCLYIASGSDQTELREVMKFRGLGDLFSGIYGGPVPKARHLQNLQTKCPNKRWLFVGDSKADFDSAKSAGMPFIFVNSFSQDKQGITEIALTHNIPTFRDLKHLNYFIEHSEINNAYFLSVSRELTL
ncbi:HAD family hydrolase [uncultured Thalassospira sp.]|uniref:HAD family hydrolase n=1 Tax=uncultured Thalassospira sp. TaxID=404382 RepID=UPI0025905A2D|nr:HAD family hydrolase [uncultured Thalassospira sp.]